MAEWFEVFDDERVLAAARRRTRHAVVAFALGSLLSVAGALLAAVAWPHEVVAWPHAAAGAALGGVLLLTTLAVGTLRRLTRLHRTLWKVELSVGRIVGHDVGGRRVSVPWTAVDALDVQSDGLAVTGHDDAGHPVHLVVPASISQFTVFGHRAVGYAEAFGRPLWVDGQPWQRLDLAELYPVVGQDSAPTV